MAKSCPYTKYSMGISVSFAWVSVVVGDLCGRIIWKVSEIRVMSV